MGFRVEGQFVRLSVLGFGPSATQLLSGLTETGSFVLLKSSTNNNINNDNNNNNTNNDTNNNNSNNNNS